MKSRHPLDPLSAEEIHTATQILKNNKKLDETYRFAYVMLHEPHQDDVLKFREGDDCERCAFINVFNSKTNETFDAVVNLNKAYVIEWTQLALDQFPYGQPPLLISEFKKCERIVKADPQWREALRNRGLSEHEIDNVQVDPWSPGYFNRDEDKGKRLMNTVCYYREHPDDNGYARPIEGLVAVIDLANDRLHRLEDDGRNTPIPRTIINYHANDYPEKRQGIKPLDIVQPEGPSFKVNGWEVEWQNWKFRVGFNQREGLVLHGVTIDDEGKERPVLYRASITDMAVPYADTGTNNFWKCALDASEYGFGRLANQLELGCDCVGNIYYFDVPAADDNGDPILLKHAICMHEEDSGTQWKHHDTRTGVSEIRRGRELIVSFFTTIGNYDYGFYWHLGQDGCIKLEVKLTGIVQTAAVYPGCDYEWGGMLAPGLAGPTHQHIFNARIHTMIDGAKNSVSETEFCSLPISEQNPFGNAFGARTVYLENEVNAARDANAATQRTWKIFNSSFLNWAEKPTAYKLELPQTPMLLADPESTIYKRAGFATKAVWVTQYDPKEKYATGDYPNQHAGGDGLPKYIQQNRNIKNESVVIWVNFGATHLPRPEDFPVMPVAKVGFEMKPFGFFNKNPTMDLPATRNHKSVKQDDCCMKDPSGMNVNLYGIRIFDGAKTKEMEGVSCCSSVSNRK